MTRQQFTLLVSALALLGSTVASAQTVTETTREANEALRAYLPFDNTTDFDDAQRGFIATLDDPRIMGPGGSVAYDVSQFDFLEGDAPDTVNPSLWRQSSLNALHGLFEVIPGIYQVRAFDLANISFIRGETGWIVVDPLTVNETAAAALELLQEEVEDVPVSAVILTHSHIDHFGGVKGVVTPEEIEERGVEVIAPEHFFIESVNENLMAGNQMSRRAIYMYGNILPKGPSGTLGSGLGTTTSTGTITIVEPTIEISETPTSLTVDGLEMTFLNTPGAEAPAELMFYIHPYNAMMQTEIINHTLHNLYTLRGAQVRNGLLWSKYIHETITRFGNEVEVSFGSHHWPTWGNERIVDFWEGHRDTYRYIHDEVLRLANHGLTMLEVAEAVTLPDSLAQRFANRGYYGSVSHDAKAQYQLYFGWFSGNPSELHELPPVEEGRKFVEYMGGADNVIEKARADYENGEYRWVATALNHVVFAEPDNAEAKAFLADTLEQLGFQAESGPWRNFYLSGAKELREGMIEVAAPETASADIVRNLGLETYLDYLAVRLNHPEAANTEISLNFVMPDVDERFVLMVENGVLNYTLDASADDAQATVTMDRTVLDSINLGQTTLDSAIADGSVNVVGDAGKLTEFVSLLDNFELWFTIVTP